MSVNTQNVTNKSNPVKRIIAINANNGAYVLISASIFAGYVEIQEAPNPATYAGGAFAGQGLQYQRADENFANTYDLVPGAILQVGDAIRKNRSEGVPSFTYPNQQVRAATPYVQILSGTANATFVEVREWRQLESA